MLEEELKEVSFVTKRKLLTFHPSICIPVNGAACFIAAAICEVRETKNSYDDEARSFRIVGLPDGKKLTKSYHVRATGLSCIVAAVDLDETDLV